MIFLFELTPNKETIEAMEEAKRITYDSSIKGYDNLDELFEELKSWLPCSNVWCFLIQKTPLIRDVHSCIKKNTIILITITTLPIMINIIDAKLL